MITINRKRYNYSFLVMSLLPLLCGPLKYHVNILNAVAGCSEFSNDRCRYFSLSDSQYKIYLTEMKKEKRNPTEEMKQLFTQGLYADKPCPKPSAKRFNDITNGILTFKYDVCERKFRNDVIDVLINGENSHMEQSEIDDLLNSAKNDNIYTFIFNCFQTAIMCGGNTAQRILHKSDLKEAHQKTVCEVKKYTDAEKDILRKPRKEDDEN